MSESQLRRAYDLIKQGREQEAIDIIEPLIRFDPDNGDAWWLLANATDDPDSKRNALNNVLRLSDNATRTQKAQQMLRILNTSQQDNEIFDDFESFDSFDDPYSSSPPKRGVADPQPQAPVIVNERRRGGPGCCMGCLGVIGVLVVISCIGIFALAALAPRIFEEGFDFLSIPAETEYRTEGTIEPGQVVSNEVMNDEDRIGYIYSTDRAENITIRIETGGSLPPIAFVYDLDNGELLFSNFSTEANSGRSGFGEYEASLPGAGDYLIIVRTYPFVGFGATEFTMEVVP
jgi:tetratricopeptide (TPR) repeat protein